MKKILLISALLILITSPAWALSTALQAVVGAAGPVYTDCSTCTDTNVVFCYYGDYTGDTDKACLSSSTTLDGTLSNATVVDSGTDPGTASPTSAGNVLKSDGNTYYLGYTPGSVTGLDLTGEEGRFEADIYVGNLTGTCQVFYLYYGANDYIKLLVSADNKLRIEHVGNSVVTSMTGGDAVPENTWTHIQFRWSAANDKISTKVGANDWDDDADADAVTAFVANAASMRLANSPATGNTVYLDNVKIYSVSGL